MRSSQCGFAIDELNESEQVCPRCGEDSHDGESAELEYFRWLLDLEGPTAIAEMQAPEREDDSYGGEFDHICSPNYDTSAFLDELAGEAKAIEESLAEPWIEPANHLVN
jgi:hypothetical protein